MIVAAVVRGSHEYESTLRHDADEGWTGAGTTGQPARCYISTGGFVQ